MDFRHIDAFRALMLTRTTTNAAALIGISQSAISRLLAELESLTNLTLFDRQRGRLEPTREAQLFFEEVQRRYTGLEYLREFALQLSSPKSATLRVGGLVTYSFGFFGLAMAEFRRQHDQAKVILTTGSSEEIRNQLLGRSVELGIVAAGRDISQFQQRFEFVQPALCAVPAGSPLARQRTIRLAELVKHPFIAYREADMVRWGVMQKMAEHAKHIDIAATVSFAPNVCALASQGVGVGLVQAIGAYDYLDNPGIAFRPLEEDIRFHTYLVTPPEAAPSALGESFMDILQRTFNAVLAAVDEQCSPHRPAR